MFEDSKIKLNSRTASGCRSQFLDHRLGANFRNNTVLHMNLFQYEIFISCAAPFLSIRLRFILYDQLLNKGF